MAVTRIEFPGDDPKALSSGLSDLGVGALVHDLFVEPDG